MINLQNISFSYPKSRRQALTEVCAEIPEGIYLLAGENGAGKTTLLHVMAGIIRPQSGQCLLSGTNAASTTPCEMGKAFLLEENMSFPGRSIREFASLHSLFYPGFSEEQFTKNLQAFGHSGLEPMRKLSLGNLKKAQLAYALALGTEVLLLDEPTNALDIEGREILRKLLASNISQEQTVIISTHTVADLEQLFDGAMIMKGSRLLFAGTGEDVSSRLTFDYSTAPDPEALYSEGNLGRYLNIYPASEGEESKVAWKSLYMALHSPAAEQITSHLSNK